MCLAIPKNSWWLTACFTLLVMVLHAQSTAYTLRGTVRDAEGERLAGASVYVLPSLTGATTDGRGNYALSLQEGTYSLVVSFIGYRNDTAQLTMDRDQQYDVVLQAVAVESQEVEIIGTRTDRNVETTEMGRVELSMEEIELLPAFLGEVDILRVIQLLPGVQTGGEGSTGLYVRGGGPDQNLVLLDNAQLYNPSHLLGFFSVFNGDVVDNVELIKGTMPAEYGGRLASVVNVSMRDGDPQKFGVHGGIGLISSRLTVEGPLKKDTSSFIVSGRRTYIDVLLNPLVSDTSQFNGSGYYFYDINARVNYILGPKDRLHLSGYYGRDVFSFKDRDNNFDVSSPWGNAMASFGWNHLFNNKLSMNTSVLFTDYQFEFTGGQDDFVFQLYTSIRDWSLKFDFDYLPNNRHHIRFGIGNTYHTFTPGNVTARTDEVNFNTGELIRQYAQEGGIYVQDEFTVTDQLTVNAGLRFSLFGQFGPFKRFIRDETNTERIVDTTEYGRAEKVALYTGWEPRLAVRYRLNSRASIKGGITHNYQYVHLASYSPLSLPMDIWMPSSDVVEPQVGTQYALGYFRNFKEDTYETSVEVYYKTMNNLVEFQEGALPSDNVADNPDNNLTFGDGYSYGAEFFVKKRLGKLTGWIGYTWSKTEREFDEINGGEIFPARYDRRHDLSTVATYKLNDRWTVAGTFVYGTGQAITLPVARYVVEGEIVNEYGPRNGFRLGAYHRLDFSATLHGKKRKRFESSWTFAVYNVYNRANPYFIYFDNEGNLEDGTLEITAKQVSLFPILPSVTWNFKF